MRIRSTPPSALELKCLFTATFVLYAGLLLSFCVWQLSRPGGPNVTVWVLQVLPLLIFIPGMLAIRRRTYLWMCFVLLAYFVKGVEGVMSPARVWIDFVVLVDSVLLFISAMLTSRALAAAHAHSNV